MADGAARSGAVVGGLPLVPDLGRRRHLGRHPRRAAGPGPGRAAGRDPQPSAAVLDAQSIKSSEGGEARGFDMGKKTTGRKRHLIVDTLGLLLVVMVTSATVQDRPKPSRNNPSL